MFVKSNLRRKFVESFAELDFSILCCNAGGILGLWLGNFGSVELVIYFQCL
jgi:hypothetical protein